MENKINIEVDGRMASIKRAIEAARVCLFGASANDDELEFSRAVNVELLFDGRTGSADSEADIRGRERAQKLGRKYAYIQFWDDYAGRRVTERFPVKNVYAIAVTKADPGDFRGRL